jgi:hypothetical protein
VIPWGGRHLVGFWCAFAETPKGSEDRKLCCWVVCWCGSHRSKPGHHPQMQVAHQHFSAFQSLAHLVSTGICHQLSCVVWWKLCRTVKCVEVNKEARLSFEQSLSRLPASVNSNISWHCADASVVSSLESSLLRICRFFYMMANTMGPQEFLKFCLLFCFVVTHQVARGSQCCDCGSTKKGSRPSCHWSFAHSLLTRAWQDQIPIFKNYWQVRHYVQ